jgi:hypothetical protein
MEKTDNNVNKDLEEEEYLVFILKKLHFRPEHDISLAL